MNLPIIFYHISYLSIKYFDAKAIYMMSIMIIIMVCLLVYRGINAMKLVHVQSVLPQDDVIALKEKTGESSVKEAISKAVYHYLKCGKEA